MSEPCVDVRCKEHGTTVAVAVPREPRGGAVACCTNTGMNRQIRTELDIERHARFIIGELIDYPNVAQLPALAGFCEQCHHDIQIPPRELGAKIQQVRRTSTDRVLRVG